MANIDQTHCRFCAETKASNKLINLVKDREKYEEILHKLTVLNAVYVDFSNNNNSLLPKTICLVCYESLNKAIDFLEKVKRSQEVLINLFITNDCTKTDLSDDDRMGFDDYGLPESVGETSPLIKEEVSYPENAKVVLNLDNITYNVLEVKEELKVEETDKAPENVSESPSNVEFDNTLNVQDLLGATICNVPYESDVTIYAKEVTDTRKRIVPLWKDYPWICAHCNMEFLDLPALRSHSKIAHGKCNAFVCFDCKSYVKSDFESFLKHVRRHRRRLRKRCHYCDAYMSEDLLSTHVAQHLVKLQVPCDLCGEILKNEEALQKHLGDYNSMKPKRKPRRKRGTPITVAELTCELCKKVYKNPNSLRDHMKLHTNNRTKNYTCDRCGKMFYNKGTLTSHIMSHDQIRPHTCKICNKSFLFPNMLRRHVDMHSGIKPFSCEECGRGFRLLYQLNAHKIIHTDAMPYVCEYCNKAFRFRQILKNHERQHTGAKPYACQICGMEFTNWSNYNKHMKRRHNTDTSKKKITPEGVFPVNPQTGQIVQFTDPDTEEWKNKIMKPGKRGKKKLIKEESGS
ncbi:Zinc finger protein 254 [Papilio machaon]|uniref:Zinc finger protein 254 n=1 Tax=Papilio machaon TaxID=76193 RepID=A0A0N1IFZ7_PAPMA|nr:Zinc finger protein 254 [Papilio machaon]